jgi:hypothetical protein
MVFVRQVSLQQKLQEFVNTRAVSQDDISSCCDGSIFDDAAKHFRMYKDSSDRVKCRKKLYNLWRNNNMQIGVRIISVDKVPNSSISQEYLDNANDNSSDDNSDESSSSQLGEMSSDPEYETNPDYQRCFGY